MIRVSSVGFDLGSAWWLGKEYPEGAVPGGIWREDEGVDGGEEEAREEGEEDGEDGGAVEIHCWLAGWLDESARVLE